MKLSLRFAALISIPNYTVISPCNSNEIEDAWYLAIKRKTSLTSYSL